MSDLLTTQQVQTLLQVDRTTIYRMLKDGRLFGVKVGHQWRFPRQQIESLLQGYDLPQHEETPPVPQESLPVDCFQLMQDIFTDITEIGAVTIKAEGTPLTQASLNCQFCQMIMNSETGYKACQASRQKLITNVEEQSFAVCHAGLHYLQAPIKINDTVTAILIAGQFYNQSPDKAEEAARVRKLAQKNNIDEVALAEAARDILVLNGRNKAKIGDWLNKIAATFEHISCERAGYMNRLQKIAAISDLNHDPIHTAA